MTMTTDIPLTIAVALLIGNAADLLQNHREDLMVNGIVEIVAAIALLLWAAIPGERFEPQRHKEHEEQPL